MTCPARSGKLRPRSRRRRARPEGATIDARYQHGAVLRVAGQRLAAGEGAGPALRAVWHRLRGEWDAAHAIVQELAGADAAWVHAWLHRVEGDLGNAGYWYRRARGRG